MRAKPFSRTVESLESRRLLSSAVLLASGQLRITGQDKVDDVVTVGLNSRGTKVEVTEGGVTRSFDKSGIKTVAFYGQGGADTFNVSETDRAFGIQTRFFGGDGADAFNGGSEADFAYGAAGNDTLNLGDGKNVAYGGSGNDTITGGSDRDVLFGENGNDKIKAGRGTNLVWGGAGTDALVETDAASTLTTTLVSVEGIDPIAISKIYVIYNGTGDATVINPYSSAGVTVSAVGGAVTVTGASGINNLEYDLLGTSPAGSFAMSSTTPATFVLSGVSLTNASGPAINITGGQTATFVSNDGTTNTLSDGSGNTKNAALQTDGKIIFSGAGALSLTGVKKHGVSTSSSIEVQSSAITVAAAASDGLHSEGFTQSGGSVTVTSSTGDGIDAGDGAIAISNGAITVTSTSADVKALKTGKGTIGITGGTLNLNVSGNASKAVSSTGAITITGGTIGIALSGAAVFTASGSGVDGSYAAGIKSSGAITIGGGNLTITAASTATGAKGISSGGDLTITNGTFNTSTAAASGTYVNASGVADSYSTASFDSDANLIVNGGTFTVGNTGTGGRGFNADGTITVTGGTIGLTNSGAAGRGFNADGDVNFSGGSTTMSLSGATVLTTSGSGVDPAYPTAVKADGAIGVGNTAGITVTGTSAATGARGLSAGTGGISVTGGTLGVNLAGNGAAYTNSTGVKDSYKSAALSSDTTINVSGGTINLTNSGTAGRGFAANGNITFTGSTSTVNLSGATLLAASGSGNDPSYPTGVKSDTTLAVSSGSVTVTGTSAATGARGLSAATINVTGGSVSATLAGNGATFTNSTGATDSYSAAALSAETALSITGGTVTTSSSGTGGKGLKSDGTLTIGSSTGSPIVNVTTTGARFLQSGTDYNHPKTVVATGAINVVNGTTTINSTDDGIHSDTSVTVSGGTNTVTASSATSGVGEGIEAPLITLSGGVNKVTASNDGLNGTYGTVVGGTESNDGSQINIIGGTNIIVGNDAIDANGNLTVSGGVTVVGGPASNPEEDIDYNGTYLQNGGLLFGGGPNNSMTKAAATTSTQVNLYLKSSTAVATTSLIHIRTSAGVEIATFKPKNSNYYFHVGSAALAKGTQYQVYFGGTYTGGSFYGGANTWGLYTGGTYSTAGATLKTTFTTSATATTNTVTF